MYKFDRNHQYSFGDFNQPPGMEMNSENRWVKKLLWHGTYLYQTRYYDPFINHALNCRNESQRYCEGDFSFVIVSLSCWGDESIIDLSVGIVWQMLRNH